MENQDIYYNTLKHVSDVIKANAIILNKQFERQRRLGTEADLLIARIDFLSDMARELREE